MDCKFTNNYNIINNINNINTNNSNNNCYDYLFKKRHRLNSYEGLFNIFPNVEKDRNINEIDIINNFNCSFKNLKDEFEEDNFYKGIILDNCTFSKDKIVYYI